METFSDRLRRHLSVLLRLAWPVMLSRAGILVMALADFIMVGRHAVEELNALALAFSIMIPVMVTGIGLTFGALSLISRHVGAGDADEAAETFWRGLSWTMFLGLIGCGIVWMSPAILSAVGHAPEIAATGGGVARALAFGLWLQLLYVACGYFLEANGRPMLVLYAMIAANLVNVAGNWLLIEDGGAFGAAIASTIARGAVFAILIVLILRLPAIRAALARSRSVWGPGGWAAGRSMRAIGFAGGAATFVETFAFSTLTQTAGLIGPVALATYSIFHNIEATLFMFALGLAIATGVRVGAETGAGRPAEAVFVGWTGLGATVALMAVLGGLMVIFAAPIAGIYTTDPVVLGALIALLPFLAISMLFDGGQIVLASAVRALGDTWIGAMCFVTGFGLVMTPIGIYLGLYRDWGALGLVTGTIIGAATALVLGALRFHALKGRAWG